MTPPFAPPVDQLLTLGSPGGISDLWTDYVELGISHEHVPELIRMASDPELNQADSESLEVWAPLHAWRALGQLRAGSAVEPLTRLLAAAAAEDDWLHSDLPQALGMIGGPALGPSRELLASVDLDEGQRLAAMSVISAVAQQRPELRDEAVGVLATQLALWPDQEPGMNALLISDLAELRVVEAAPIMEAAFRAGRVAEFWCGDWEDVQVQMGLLAERITPRPSLLPEFDSFPPVSPVPTHSRPRSSAKSKNRRKEAQAARKRNRRK